MLAAMASTLQIAHETARATIGEPHRFVSGDPWAARCAICRLSPATHTATLESTCPPKTHPRSSTSSSPTTSPSWPSRATPFSS